MPSSHLILSRPLLLLPLIPPRIRVFSSESTLHMRWPKYWSFSFRSIPSKEIPGADLLQNGLVGSPCSPRDSQESSPTPQCKRINAYLLVTSNCFLPLVLVFPGGSDSKASAYNVGDLGSIPGLGRSPGEGNSNPLQYSCLENPMDGGAW